MLFIFLFALGYANPAYTVNCSKANDMVDRIAMPLCLLFVYFIRADRQTDTLFSTEKIIKYIF